MSATDIIARAVALDERGLNPDAIASTLGTSRRMVDLALSWRSKTQGKHAGRPPAVADIPAPSQPLPQPQAAGLTSPHALSSVGPPKLTASRRKALAALAARRGSTDPTPEEIRQRADEIRAGWSREMRRSRRLLLPTRWSVPTFSASELRCVDYCEG